MTKREWLKLLGVTLVGCTLGWGGVFFAERGHTVERNTQCGCEAKGCTFGPEYVDYCACCKGQCTGMPPGKDPTEVACCHRKKP